MVTRREWYRRVNVEWPENVPELTRDEAERAARRLFRFVLKSTFRGRIRFTTGCRYNKAYGNLLVLNPGRGWKNMVHELSHWLHRGPHSGEHARTERRMIKEVIRRGWLTGNLKSEPRPKAPVREQRYASVVKRIGEWERRLKRAEGALKKLREKRRYYESTGMQP